MSTPKPDLVSSILDAWGLVDPLRSAVQLLLDFGRIANPAIAIDGALMLVAAARQNDKASRRRRRSDVYASCVAATFGLGLHFRGALIELRWAGLAGSAEERNAHLEHAEMRLAAAKAELRKGGALAAPAKLVTLSEARL